MTTFLSFSRHPFVLFPVTELEPTRASKLLLPPRYNGFSNNKRRLRSAVGVVRSGLQPDFLPDLDSAEGLIRGVFGKAEGFLYTIADAAVSSSDSVNGAKQNSDWLSGITNYLETVLKVLKDGLSTLHVPYAYGFAIILLTVIVKAATFPLTKKQVESAMAMRSLQPQVKAIQQRYSGDQERIQLETARLYKLAGVNPLAGCLPTLATIPVWIGLYRALSNVADEGLLTEGFFWIPSLSGPTTIAARQSGSGISWLFPFIDGHPPLGWSDTLAYLVLPVLLVVSQYISIQIMQPSQGNDPNLKSSQALTKFLPLMIGYFSLSVPSGLSLYWLTNNILSTTQQIWLQKLGGAKDPMAQFSDATSREELSKIQKPVIQAGSTVTETQQEENSTSGGLRRGERFKQIKEQEARRRQQREEERRKAEEAVKGAGIINVEDESKAKLAKEKAETELVDIRNERVEPVNDMQISSNIGVPLVNGDQSIQDLEKDHNSMTAPKMENGGLAVDSELKRKDEHHSNENLKEEKVVEAYTTKFNKEAAENTHREKLEQPGQRDEA
ncbi:PREDICTED: ALBINO3-like protein 1, chloroplastic [Nelumbo nucifera]|uniref:ALBINO3-like protein 1, chloroplastic n=1 Tax=Nelumbo nucifera TaxID=4432 RepID=A0A1U7ZLI3_NELNU|nr:PREDICTED: ALBINO3-like protein 1, chloroplastic [Nelumbo nucifera]